MGHDEHQPSVAFFSQKDIASCRLAMVKSFVLMIDLRCDDLVRQLFETAFEAINPEHSIRVENVLPPNQSNPHARMRDRTDA